MSSSTEDQPEQPPPPRSSPWQALKRFLSPSSLHIRELLFSTGDLPANPVGVRYRSTRADRIPETEEDEAGQRPTVRDYHSINAVPPNVRVPKKMATPIQVEGKVGPNVFFGDYEAEQPQGLVRK